MKRLLSWLLALVMIISCLPMSAIPAFAEETPETGVGDIQNPDFETPLDKLDPEVLEELGFKDAVQVAGDAEGNFYSYTAPADGEVTLYINPMYDDEGKVIEHVFDIIVENQTTKETLTLLKDGKDNYGLELVVPVKAGQELLINTIWVKDAAGVEYPAGEYTWVGNFAYPAGSEKNPITIEWTWDDAYANATATVIVPEGGAYYTGKAGMILTVGETVTAMDAEGKFNIAAAGTYELKLATPVGAQANPEVIENINGFIDTVKLEADGAYYYIWTATEDGTVTLDVTDGANIKVDQIIEMSEDGWPVSKQHELAEPEIDENWNYTGWTVAENLAIEVVTGQQLKIQVNGLTDWATWSTPAIEYTLTGEFTPAVVAPEYNVTTSGYGLSLDAELVVSAKFLIPEELRNDTNATIKIQFINKVTEANLCEYIAEHGLDSKKRLVIEQSVSSSLMPHVVKVTICDGNGNAADYTDYFGETHEGIYEFGAETYVKLTTVVDPGQTTIDCVRGLLTYGAYAQEHFRSTGSVANIPEMLATEILTKYGYEPIDISNFTADLLNQEVTTSGDNFDGISCRGVANPVLDAAIYMVFQFNAANITEADMNNYTYKLSYMVGSTLIEKDIAPTWDARGRLVFNITDIAARNFDTMYSVTITKISTNESYTATTSVIAYMDLAFETYENVASQTKFLNLLKAMYYYNQAANTHFGN